MSRHCLDLGTGRRGYNHSSQTSNEREYHIMVEVFGTGSSVGKKLALRHSLWQAVAASSLKCGESKFRPPSLLYAPAFVMLIEV